MFNKSIFKYLPLLSLWLAPVAQANQTLIQLPGEHAFSTLSGVDTKNMMVLPKTWAPTDRFIQSFNAHPYLCSAAALGLSTYVVTAFYRQHRQYKLLEKNVDKNYTKNTKVEERIKEINDKKLKLDEQVENITKEKEKYEEEKKLLEQQVSKQDTNIKNNQKELEKANVKNQTELKEHQEKLQAANTAKLELEKELEELKKQNKETKENYETSLKKLTEDQQTEKEKLAQAHTQQSAKYEEEKKLLEQQVSKQDTNIKNNQKELEKANVKNQTELKEHQEKLEAANTAKQDLEKKLEELEKQNKETKENYETSLKKLIEDQQTEKEKLKQERTQQIEKHDEEKKLLKQQIIEQDTNIKNSKKELEKTNKEKQALENEKLKLENQLQELTKNNKALEKSIREKGQELNRLVQKLGQQKKQLQEAEEKIQKTAQLEQELYLIKFDYTQLEKAINAAETELASTDKENLSAWIEKYQKLYAGYFKSYVEITSYLEGTGTLDLVNREALETHVKELSKFCQLFIYAKNILEAAQNTLNMNASVYESPKLSKELQDFKEQVIDDQQVARHITKHMEMYKNLIKTQAKDEELNLILSEKIRKWIIEGGNVWHTLKDKSKLSELEITEIFWFLYSQGLLHGLVRSGPENFSFVLDDSMQGKKLFRLLEKLVPQNTAGKKEQRKATHLTSSSGFKNQLTYELKFWDKSPGKFFLPMGMQVILFMSADYQMPDGQIKKIYFFKPESYSGKVKLSTDALLHGFELAVSKGRKLLKPLLGSGDDAPCFQKERVPQQFSAARTSDENSQKPLFDTQGNTNLSNLVKLFYEHFQDTHRRIGNEIAINETTNQMAALYSSRYDTQNIEQKTAKAILEAQYKLNRQKSMYAWGLQLFPQNIGVLAYFDSLSRATLYENIVAELNYDAASRAEWLEKEKKPLELLQKLLKSINDLETTLKKLLLLQNSLALYSSQEIDETKWRNEVISILSPNMPKDCEKAANLTANISITNDELRDLLNNIIGKLISDLFTEKINPLFNGNNELTQSTFQAEEQVQVKKE